MTLRLPLPHHPLPSISNFRTDHSTAITKQPLTTTTTISVAGRPETESHGFRFGFRFPPQMPYHSLSTASSTAIAASDSSSSSSCSSPSTISEVLNFLCVTYLLSLGQSGPNEPEPRLNKGPLIGILSHPGDGASGRLSKEPTVSYIAASYVKLVEAGGGRVIPLIYNEPTDALLQKLNVVNGVVFTGGWCMEGPYYEVIQMIFQKILERNDAGNHCPLFAICLGLEMISKIISKDENILERFQSKNMTSILQFPEAFDPKGTVFQRFSADLLKKVGTKRLALQSHQWGISPQRFEKNEHLSRFFRVLNTSKDEEGKVYVSTIQALDYPIIAFQWHPEKNAFEWGRKNIPHSEDAVRVTQEAANFLISEAKKSTNKLPPPQFVLDNLIYNYSPTYCGKKGRGFDQVYLFTQCSPSQPACS